MEWTRFCSIDNDEEETERELARDDLSPRLTEKLIRSRTILISSSIDERIVDRVIKQLVLMEQDSADKRVTVFINCPGGGADCAFAIYDMLRFGTAPVRAVCTGICASAGVIIFLGSAKGERLALPNSRFMIHEPRFLSTAYGQAADLAITAKELLKMKDRYNAIVAEATGKDQEAVGKDVKRDFWLSAEEAVKYGLVDKVIRSRSELA